MPQSYQKSKNLSYTYRTRTFSGQIVWENNKKRLRVTSEMYYQTEINKLNVGDRVTMYITNAKPKRTEQQNRYLWGVYYPAIAAETGENDLEYLHECFKQKFLVKGTKTVMGQEIKIYGSTTDLSVSDFMKFVMDIETFTGIQAPPTENYQLAPLK